LFSCFSLGDDDFGDAFSVLAMEIWTRSVNPMP
jgi:hypothetical protein